MTDLPVSVVIVSRGRAHSLIRTLTGIAQLQYGTFEVVVVADPDGIEAAGTFPFAKDLKLVPFDEANISAARNLGLLHAAGTLVAFIDDDAVPEPQWLRHLTVPVAEPRVAALGGPVRGRNGISFQRHAASLDGLGGDHSLDIDPVQPTVLMPEQDQAIKTEGTNMAFRRDVLAAVGGFDPAFHYFLDETDLNMRLARAGHATAFVPLAEVHHGYAANNTRTAARTPRDLFDIGASWAVFHRKHLPPGAWAREWERQRALQRARLLRFMGTGQLEPRDLRRLMARLDLGYAEGALRNLVPLDPLADAATPFKAFPARRMPSIMIVTRPFHAARDRALALQESAAGKIVTLLILSPTALFHHLGFGHDGIWVQSGGVFGKSDRNDRLILPTSRSKRAERERCRVALQRGLSHTICTNAP